MVCIELYYTQSEMCYVLNTINWIQVRVSECNILSFCHNKWMNVWLYVLCCHYYCTIMCLWNLSSCNSLLRISPYSYEMDESLSCHCWIVAISVSSNNNNENHFHSFINDSVYGTFFEQKCEQCRLNVNCNPCWITIIFTKINKLFISVSCLDTWNVIV